MPIMQEYPDELTHYGRLGMKWGQHIFGKDKTGSGKRRSTKKKKATIRERLKNRKINKIEKVRATMAEQEVLRRKKILSDPKLLDRYKSEFTSEEINNAIDRFRVEKNLKAIANETHAERLKSARKGQEYAKLVVDYTATSMNAYNNFAKIYNAFSDDKGKKFPIIGEKPNQQKQEEKKDDSKQEEKKKP